MTKFLKVADDLAAVFAGRAATYDASGDFAREDFDDLREAGLLSVAVPEKYGGLGPEAGYAGALPYEVIRRIARGSSSTAWSLMVHYHQCGVIARLGSDEQAARILGDVVTHGALIASAGSEVNPAQSTASVDTERVFTYDKADVLVNKEGLTINGTKHFCTLAPEARYFLYWALAPGASGTADGLFNAVVDATHGGISLDPNMWDQATGQRSTATWSVSFDQVKVPWEDVLGEPGDWVQKDTYTFELTMACQLLGTLQGAFDVLLDVVRQRPFLMLEEGVPNLVGSMSAALQGVAASIEHGDELWKEERWGEAAVASLQALHLAHEALRTIAADGFGIIGARSILTSLPWERIIRDARTASLHTRDSQVLKLIATAAVDGDYFVKQKYGMPTEKRLMWSEILR